MGRLVVFQERCSIASFRRNLDVRKEIFYCRPVYKYNIDIVSVNTKSQDMKIVQDVFTASKYTSGVENDWRTMERKD